MVRPPMMTPPAANFPPIDLAKLGVIAKTLSDNEVDALMVHLQRRRELSRLKDEIQKTLYLSGADRNALVDAIEKLAHS